MIAESADFTAIEMECLNCILGTGSANAGELVEVSGLTSGAITGLIRRLEAREYVSRREDRADKRKKRLLLQTLAIFERSERYIEKFSKKAPEFLDTFSEAELEIMTSIL